MGSAPVTEMNRNDDVFPVPASFSLILASLPSSWAARSMQGVGFGAGWQGRSMASRKAAPVERQCRPAMRTMKLGHRAAWRLGKTAALGGWTCSREKRIDRRGWYRD
ncbi:hypothetical protein GUJ93_ZPchr0006g42097 [Zizania palustris]|uniref:Uncharacterized protein n=1 Tax=Zizania palustris TaxID=103762 RepID=A0A8J5T1W8_ZIZPA|nr:hypothetical protein GUJ93_ZPchr0006g42097 [Zizania palustris]